MPDFDFFKPHRQSKIGIVLIFSTTLFQLIRNFWVIAVYFLVQDIEPRYIFLAGMAFFVVLLLALTYSIFYYLKFIFYIDKEREAFILKKGVFSSDVVNIPFAKIQQVNFKRNILQRILGVYSIEIDTAGSQQEEVEIKALSEEKANRLSVILMEFAGAEQASSVGNQQEKEEQEIIDTEPEWEYNLGFLSLLKLGLTSNYFRGLAILVAFYFTLEDQFGISEELPVDVPNFFKLELASSLLLILGLIFIGMLITLAETFIKYYNLRLIKNSSGLQVEMGLRDNTRVNLRARRLQVLQVFTNPLQKKLNLNRLQITLASSRDSLSKNQIKIPGLPENIVKDVKEYFYTSGAGEEILIKPDKILLYRGIFRRMLPLIFAFIGIKTFALQFSILGLSLIIGVYVVAVIIYQVLYYNSLMLTVSKDFIIKNSGIWNKRKQIAESYKLQAVSVNQPFLWKKRELFNITFHTAGGDIVFEVIKGKEVFPLVNYLLYKIQSTQKAWM